MTEVTEFTGTIHPREVGAVGAGAPPAPTRPQAAPTNWPWRFAERVIELGWHVFPCRPHGKTPVPGMHWDDESTTDPATIAGWEAKWPSANLGIDLAKSGLLVIDVDTKVKDPDDGRYYASMDGYNAIADLFAKENWWPESEQMTASTGNGGWHIYFRQPDPPLRGRGQRSEVLGPLIDVKGEGGYVLAPGSWVEPTVTVFDSDGLYRKEKEAILGNCPVVPDWLAARIAPPPPKPVDMLTRMRAVRALADGGWKDRIDRLATTTVARNDTLNAVAYTLRDVLLSRNGPTLGDVVVALGSACEANGLVADDGRRSVRATIASGLGINPATVEVHW